MSPAGPGPRWPPARLLWLVGGLTLLRLLVAASFELTDEEASLRLWSLVPDWGYLERPPLAAWLAWLGRALLGDSALGLRLAGPLLAAGGSLALWRAALLLAGPRVADRTLLLFHALPLVGLGAVIATPDAAATFCWSLVLWCLAEFLVMRRPGWLLAAGLALGLGLLAKFSLFWFALGLLLWLLRHPALRPAFRLWQLWAGGLLALLVLLPLLLWNAGQGWPSVAPHLQALAGWRPDAPGFLGQLLFVQLLALGVLPVPFVAWGFWLALRSRDPVRSLPALTLLPFLLFLLLWSLHGEVLGPWSAPLYPGFALLAVLGLEAALQGDRRPWSYLARATWRSGLPAAFGAVFLLYGYVALPGMPVLTTKETTLQARGWEQLAAELEALRRAQGAEWIATQGHATAAQLAYYLPEVPVLQLGERQRTLNLPLPTPGLLQRPALVVEIDRRLDLGDLEARFAELLPLATLERRSGDLVLRRYSVFLAANPRGSPLD